MPHQTVREKAASGRPAVAASAETQAPDRLRDCWRGHTALPNGSARPHPPGSRPRSSRGVGITVALLLLSAGAQASETTTYDYDAQGRLIKTSKAGGPVAGQQKCTDYDPAGNRTSRTVSSSACSPGGGGGGSAPSFAINDPPANLEGGAIVFTVTKTGTGAASVTYSSANISAAAGSDYGAVSGVLNFASSDTSQTITVATYTDAVAEANETFAINLSSPTGGASITDGQGVGTIINDDSGSCSPLCQ